MIYTLDSDYCILELNKRHSTFSRSISLLNILIYSFYKFSWYLTSLKLFLILWVQCTFFINIFQHIKFLFRWIKKENFPLTMESEEEDRMYRLILARCKQSSYARLTLTRELHQVCTMILPGYQTSDSVSSSKFHHLALPALLVVLVLRSSNLHHWTLLVLLVALGLH